jgi:TRAP-type C4-dicarboxylate transport system substrate-binding protein
MNKLKEKDQQIVRDVMSATFKRIDSGNRKDNIAAREALKKQGIEFISLSKESLAAWHVIGDKAMRILEKKNKYSEPIYKKIMESVEAARKAHP